MTGRTIRTPKPADPLQSLIDENKRKRMARNRAAKPVERKDRLRRRSAAERALALSIKALDVFLGRNG